MMPKISTNSASYRCSAFRAALGCRPCMATRGILWNHMEALQLWDSSEVVFPCVFHELAVFKMFQALLLASKSRGMLWWPSRHCANAFMAPGCRKGLSIEHQRRLLELANSQHLETCWDLLWKSDYDPWNLDGRNIIVVHNISPLRSASHRFPSCCTVMWLGWPNVTNYLPLTNVQGNISCNTSLKINLLIGLLQVNIPFLLFTTTKQFFPIVNQSSFPQGSKVFSSVQYPFAAVSGPLIIWCSTSIDHTNDKTQWWNPKLKILY